MRLCLAISAKTAVNQGKMGRDRSMETSGLVGFINRNMGMALRLGIIWGITEMGIGRLGVFIRSTPNWFKP